MQDKYLRQISISLKLIAYVMIVAILFFEQGSMNEIGITFILVGIPAILLTNAFQK